MKIFFEDGTLRKPSQLPISPDFVISASLGVTANINLLDQLAQEKRELIIYTNSIFAFSNKYAWNEELNIPEIYIRAGNHMIFTRIDNLTNRELKEGHNLAKMYISGEFEERTTKFKQPIIINTSLTSFWDGGVKITSKCQVNLLTKEVFNIEKINIEGLEILEGQQIDIDNILYEVFPKEEAEENDYWYE